MVASDKERGAPWAYCGNWYHGMHALKGSNQGQDSQGRLEIGRVSRFPLKNRPGS